MTCGYSDEWTSERAQWKVQRSFQSTSLVGLEPSLLKTNTVSRQKVKSIEWPWSSYSRSDWTETWRPAPAQMRFLTSPKWCERLHVAAASFLIFLHQIPAMTKPPKNKSLVSWRFKINVSMTQGQIALIMVLALWIRGSLYHVFASGGATDPNLPSFSVNFMSMWLDTLGVGGWGMFFFWRYSTVYWRV